MKERGQIALELSILQVWAGGWNVNYLFGTCTRLALSPPIRCPSPSRCSALKMAFLPPEPRDVRDTRIPCIIHYSTVRPDEFFHVPIRLMFILLPAMDQVERPESDADFKSHSCLACRQRKVKCDRHNPCSNCVKTARPCSFVAPVRGKRKRTKVPKEGLHAKLRRYEELLKSHGADIEASEYGDDSESETASPPNVGRTEKPGAHSNAISDSFSIDDIKPRLIDKEGSSRYFDRYACSHSNIMLTSR